MQNYYFNLNECGKILTDEEGTALSTIEQVRDFAAIQARSIMCAEVAEGRLCMNCHIEVYDAGGNLALKMPFKQAIELTGV